MASGFARRLGDDFSGYVLENEPLSRHTTIRIGGPARLLIEARDLHSLIEACEACREAGIPWVALGGGSNLLVSDAGFQGAVISLGDGFSKCTFDEQLGVFSVGAGLRLSQLVRQATERGRTGLEFAVGIPGTVGGAIRMNAGTRREFLGPRVVSVTTLRPGSGLRRYVARDIEWNYRETSVPFDEVVLECEVATEPGDAEEVRHAMRKSQERRRVTQPLGLRQRVSQSRARIGGTPYRERGPEGRHVRRRADFRTACEFHREQGRREGRRSVVAYPCRI